MTINNVSKWSTDNENASLKELQAVLDKHLAAIKAVEGVKVQRVVCGGCHDFKVIISAPKAAFDSWSDGGHAPEAEFLKDMEAVAGASNVETQTYTLETL